jgi:hypothetical protein
MAAGALAAVAVIIGGVHQAADSSPLRTAQAQQQPPSPRETGPVNTQSGGAPPESPQGETPPGMQTVPEKPAEAPSNK